jgi:type IV/VI secretion system ImpK/VasF family protein
MKLPELCRPLFALVARALRQARRQTPPEHQVLRREVEAMLAALRDRAAADPPLASQFARVEAPLVFFVDYMVKEGPFPFASAWQELAFSIGEGAGDEKFFDLLDACLADPGQDAVERLWVFYECMALGFDGMYQRERKQVQRRMRVVALRLGLDPAADRFPADTAPLAGEPGRFRHPTATARQLVASLAAVLVLLIAANAIAYHLATRELRGTIERFSTRAASDLVPDAARPAEPNMAGGR